MYSSCCSIYVTVESRVLLHIHNRWNDWWSNVQTLLLYKDTTVGRDAKEYILIATQACTYTSHTEHTDIGTAYTYLINVGMVCTEWVDMGVTAYCSIENVHVENSE